MRTARLLQFPALFTPSDEQAMRRLQEHTDEQAFTQLVDRWRDPLHRLCLRMLGDPHRGEDLAQDALTRIYVRRADYRPNQKFSTWLWRIALNLCYDELRRRTRAPAPLEPRFAESDDPGPPDAVCPQPPPDVAVLQEEAGALVRQALQELPADYRAVVVLRHYENLKLREIAEVLDIPEGTVKSRMAEAMARLAQLLRPLVDQAPGPSLPFAPARTRRMPS